MSESAGDGPDISKILQHLLSKDIISIIALIIVLFIMNIIQQ